MKPILQHYNISEVVMYGDWRREACGWENSDIRDIRSHRTQEILVAANGSEISWTALNMHDDTCTSARQFQFYQYTPAKVVLCVVPADGFGERDCQRIVQALRRKLDGRLTVVVELVESIPLSPRGKAIYVDKRIVLQAAPVS